MSATYERPVYLMAAVSRTCTSSSIVAFASGAASDDARRHGERWLLSWLAPPRDPGLWVTHGQPTDGVVSWSGKWRRATNEEATRFARGEEVWT